MSPFGKASFFAALLGCLALVIFAGPAPGAPAADNPFQGLSRRLIGDGFEQGRIEALYGDERVLFDAEGTFSFFTYSEGRLNYEQFTAPRSIAMARAYLSDQATWLKQAETRYGVDRNVVTAILLVETRLGTYLGERRVVNTLSSMASLSDPAMMEALWERIPAKRRISRELFEKKAREKSRWAYGELKALLRLSEAERIDPCGIVGSFAGAMGIAQFMPSNVLTLAVDGNQDGRIDLFDHADAIASVANYLRHHGWRPDLDRERAMRVILRYNYSRPYANTVLAVAERLRG